MKLSYNAFLPDLDKKVAPTKVVADGSVLQFQLSVVHVGSGTLQVPANQGLRDFADKTGVRFPDAAAAVNPKNAYDAGSAFVVVRYTPPRHEEYRAAILVLPLEAFKAAGIQFKGVGTQKAVDIGAIPAARFDSAGSKWAFKRHYPSPAAGD